MEILKTPAAEQVVDERNNYDVSRRRFFQLAGGVAGAGLLFAACKGGSPTDIFVGSGDTGLLNYLYIVQQVEAAFYTQAVATPYYGLTDSEQPLLRDLRDQEIAHREFLKQLLGKDAARPIETNLSVVTFADRTSFLTHATIIEDLAVAAINGAVRLFTNTEYIFVLNKMAPVEARHSAYARDLLNYNSFADSTAVDSNGLDFALAPTVVMSTLQNYMQSRFDTSKLPTY
jgi:hypothetical protein